MEMHAFSWSPPPKPHKPGLSAGAAIIISQCLGAGDHKKLSAALHTALAFAFTGGLVLSAGAVFLAPLGLRLLRVPGDVYPAALSYVRICFAGFALPMTASAGAGIFRALGNSKTPFRCLIAANLANLFLDLLLVGVFRLHTAGAAA